MSFVIAAPCIADYSCVEICPVRCISPAPGEPGFAQAEQMYIHPALCIKCGACADACPVGAIFTAAALPPQWQHYARINREYFEQ
ncbi:4Fe-4S binding protein [Pelomonas sp. KK5]|uniref:indolepyruvate ferredoxin oxidoreductase subunit alpha n=1 Tax=Pelomonas sp. KK5 TaxID=1855730 RepID=UPI00097BFDCD|nr:4Fe-4S binding protein [Pelomonas sp. KK5]